MNYYIPARYLLLLSLSASVCANPEAGSNNYWQCTTHDAGNKQWIARSVFQKIALNFAFASCKKQSQFPATCRTTRGNCEQFIQGISIKPMWKCTAIDSTATPWRSDLYSQRDDAALAAKAYCRQKSSVPGTCFVNMVTCFKSNGIGS